MRLRVVWVLEPVCGQVEDFHALSRARLDQIDHAVDGRAKQVRLLFGLFAHMNADDYLRLVAELDLAQGEKSAALLEVVLARGGQDCVCVFATVVEDFVESLRRVRLLTFRQVSERPVQVKLPLLLRVAAVSEVVTEIEES